MDLNQYMEKYDRDRLVEICHAVGSTWEYFRRIMRGDAVPSRCLAILIEQQSGGEIKFESLIKRPTEVEFERFVKSLRGKVQRNTKAEESIGMS